ncbi:MAG TPA: hypothetical protein VGO03_16420 [Acidimicrobiia bacterium]
MANRLDRLGTATYEGAGLHDERALRRHVAHLFKRLRYDVIGEPFPYAWVPEWHKTDHGLHVHFGVDRFIDQQALEAVWGRGFVDIRRIRRGGRDGGPLTASRRTAGYLAKYVTKSFEEHRRAPGLHRYEVAQGFAPKVERIVAASENELWAKAIDRMGDVPARTWHSRDSEGWTGPPAMWASWNA